MYKFRQFNICGSNPDKSNLYDKINIINIGLAKDTEEDIRTAPGIIKLLGTLFSKNMPVEVRKEILEQDFGIPMQEDVEERMSEMCNLSQDIKYEALREGRREGRREERVALIRLLLLRGDSEESIIELGFTENDIKKAKKIINKNA